MFGRELPMGFINVEHSHIGPSIDRFVKLLAFSSMVWTLGHIFYWPGQENILWPDNRSDMPSFHKILA